MERTKIAALLAEGKKEKALDGLLRRMDQDITDLASVAIYADQLMLAGNHGLAVHIYRYLLKEWEGAAPAIKAGMWCNIGFALRMEMMIPESEYAFQRGLEITPDDPNVLNSIGSCYVNNATPDKVIEWCDKALAIEPEHEPAKWNRGLAYLEKGDWKNGWPGYNQHERKSLERNYREGFMQTWTGKRNRCVVVYGEQGVGDEIMFLTCLPDMLKNCREVILDCHPRLEKTFRRSFPGLTIYPTRKTAQILWHHKHKIDAKIAAGSLAGMYRKADKDFPGTPYLKTDPEQVNFYRSKLKELGPGPYIGIAWFGGEKKTRYDYRSIPLEKFAGIRAHGGTFVSLQYNKWGHREEAKTNGLPEWSGYYDPTGPIEDLDEMMALIMACDLVISVCQTAVHMAGALGKECWCLTPNKPAWRYGITGERMAWYNSVKQFRQAPDEPWEPTLAKVAQQYSEWKGRYEAAGNDAPVHGLSSVSGMAESQPEADHAGHAGSSQNVLQATA